MKKMLEDFKKDGCVRCGDNPEDKTKIHCDHFDPEGLIDPKNKKLFILGEWGQFKGISKEIMQMELDKTQTLCALCHVEVARERKHSE